MKYLMILALLSPLAVQTGCSTGPTAGPGILYFSGGRERPSDIRAPGGAVTSWQQHRQSTNPFMEINSYTAPGSP